MKNIIILGAGRQGLAAGTFLKKRHIAVTFTDINEDSIKMAHDMGFITMKRNLSSVGNIVKVISGFDIIICALPAKLGRTAHLAAIEAKTDMVDVSYAEEDPLDLDEQANEAGITIIPDAGIAPGISNLISGYIYFQMDTINSIKINVGGLPEEYIEPMGYAITWSPNDLIDEY
ncbi:saccharopine dehydrogenase NADP-binding domain-containing protein, partial [candidate division WOR-3 bacterium]|nr:saccharopine dehydrogenase NADP-binding domain-containing protein [candidate division WOR-3 bacterium]